MRVLFVHPGPLLYTRVFLRLEPLGLELVAAVARASVLGIIWLLIVPAVLAQRDHFASPG